MMCQSIGCPPTSTMGFGLTSVSSARRVPRPTARMTTLTVWGDLACCDNWCDCGANVHAHEDVHTCVQRHACKRERHHDRQALPLHDHSGCADHSARPLVPGPVAHRF